MKHLVYFVMGFVLAGCYSGEHDIAYVTGPSGGLVPDKDPKVLLSGVLWQQGDIFLSSCSNGTTYRILLSQEASEALQGVFNVTDTVPTRAFVSIEGALSDAGNDTSVVGVLSDVEVKQLSSDIPLDCSNRMYLYQ